MCAPKCVKKNLLKANVHAVQMSKYPKWFIVLRAYVLSYAIQQLHGTMAISSFCSLTFKEIFF